MPGNRRATEPGECGSQKPWRSSPLASKVDSSTGTSGVWQKMGKDCPIFGQERLDFQDRFGRIGMSFDQREQKVQGLCIALHGSCGKLTERDFNNREMAGLAFFGDGYFLLNDVAQDRSYRPAAFRAAFWIATLAPSELRRLRGALVADFVSWWLPSRH